MLLYNRLEPGSYQGSQHALIKLGSGVPVKERSEISLSDV